jgi:hypothetical protein
MVFVLAFSLQGEVEKYGAYVGIAAFIGLALLSVLYFSQAREVRRLRDWAGRAPERDRELEQRVSAQADEHRRAPAPVRRPATVAAAGAAVAAESGAEAPGPAAVPRPANGRTPGPAAVPMGPRPATAAAAVAAAVSAVAAPASEDEAQAAEREAAAEPATTVHPPADAEPAAEPATAAAAAPEAPAKPEEPQEATPPPAETNGHGDQETGESAVADAIPRATPRQGAQQRRPAQPLRAQQRTALSGQRRQPPPPRRRPPAKVQPKPARASGGHTPSRGVLIGALAGLVVVAVVALFATGVIGGGGTDSGGNASQNASPSPSASGGGTSTGSSRAASSAASRAAATVVVLNGTTVNGLAAGEKTKLEQLGYKDVQTTNSTNQAEQQSAVTYASGERRQAMDVAKALSITSVTPLDTDTQSLANNSFAKPVQADVVVIVGADQSP